MVPVTVTALTEPAADQLTDVAAVFDQYRRHYGQPVVAGQTLAWLTEQISHRRLAIKLVVLEGIHARFLERKRGAGADRACLPDARR